MRHMLTGHGPTARQRRLIRRGMSRGVGRTPSAGQMKARAAAIDEQMKARAAGKAEQMKARAAAIDELLGRD